MQKTKLTTIELFFIIIAASTIFILTFHRMSSAGILPGNDPAVHLLKAKQIVMDERVSYSEIAWYPPAFHTILAMLQILAGTLDVMAAAFILKLMISTLNVLLLLCTYLIVRKILNKSIAVASVVFTIISVPLFETIYWGGYANILGFACIAFIFYIMVKDFQVTTKTFLLFSGALTLGLAHQLSTFVFVLMFVPTFLASTIGSKKKFIAFLAMVVGGGLALLAWYAQIVIDYGAMMIDYIFASGAENVYHISSVTLDALNKNLGVTLFLAAAGIPLTFILILKKKVPKASLLIVFWFAIPFLLSQSFLVGVNLPYHRFVYFFATPIAILSGVTVGCIIQLPFLLKLAVPKLPKLPALPRLSLISKIPKKVKISTFTKSLAAALVLTLLAVHMVCFIERIEAYPEYYDRVRVSTYKSGIWVNQQSTPDDTMVVPISPGTWFYVLSDRFTREETDPLYSRNVIAETVLYSYYEMENSRTLTHEYALESPNAGQELGVAVYNIWKNVVTIPNKYIEVKYLNASGEVEQVSLSETVEEIYWSQKSTENAQLVAEYTHELFTVKKTVTFSSNSSMIGMEWRVEAKQDLRHVTLAVNSYMDPTLDFKEAFVPGVLEWENPWDKPSYIEPDRRWAIREGPARMLDENVAAILDANHSILAVFEFGESLEWFNIGALGNYFIDSLRLTYDLGNLGIGESDVASLGVLVYAFEDEEVERLTEPEFKQQYDSETGLPVQQRDYLTYIEEENIKFIIVDTEHISYSEDLVPALDVVYNNGRMKVYRTGK